MNLSLTQYLAGARQLVDRGRALEAMQAYKHLLSAHPFCADGWYEYAWLLRRAGIPDQALAAYARALNCGIQGAEEVHLNRAVIFSEDLASPDDAEAELQQALTCRPDYGPALLNLGKLKEDLGENGAAIDLYRRLADAPNAGELALQALARLVQIEFPSQVGFGRLQRLRGEASNQERSADLRASLWFALGHCSEASSDYESAFEAFVEANRLVAERGPTYQAAAVERHINAVLSTAKTTPLASEASGYPIPLFICGMFRSGSTLLEQVLNAHPEVATGGELPFFPRLVSGALAPYTSGTALPAKLAERIRSEYHSILTRIALTQAAPNARFVTDKRPDNVLLLAVIRQVFANARVIITRRDPMDTGLSVFQQHLSQSQAPYNSELAAIGHYQAQVNRISEYAKSTWPEFVRFFNYDAFVRNPTLELQPLLEWLGLPWDDSCLRFHEKRGLVKTASHAQVRRPLHARSSGRWRAYEKHLAPLRDALSGHGWPIDQ